MILFLETIKETANMSLENLKNAVDEHWLSLKSHAVAIIVLLVLLWPIWVAIIMALTTASAWMFWVLMSMLLILVQSLYVTYQFVMIALDLMGMSILKTYSTTRRLVLYYLGEKGLGMFSQKKSRRREWRQRLEKATCYRDFLQIPLAEKPAAVDDSNKQQQNNMVRSQSTGGLLSSLSYKNMLMGNNNKKKMPRSRSFESSFPSNDNIIDDVETAILKEELGATTGELLKTTTTRLKQARQDAMARPHDEAAASALKYVLSGVVKRNHLNLEDVLVEQSRGLAESGQYGLSEVTRELIEDYYQQVEAGLQWMAESTTTTRGKDVAATSEGSSAPLLGSSVAVTSEGSRHRDESKTLSAENIPTKTTFRAKELQNRMTLVRRMKQNMGRTALMLSGGGAQGMYHMGLVKALIEAELYQDIHVISGTSGGSILAAMCAIKTPQELMDHILVPTISTDYMLTGEQKRLGIRWFPTPMEMGTYWLKKKLLVDSEFFRKTCNFYYSDVTFEEAFQKTRKHVCITVSASRASGRSPAQRLLLNHISTPHVTVASAVAASCALPGVMAPTNLMCKNTVTGDLEPFEVDGVEWIDGSILADLPFERISTLFNVSNYVVCQTNFHVLPFLNKNHHPSARSLYWRLFQTLEWDVRNRAQKLGRLGLFPRIFGQDMSKVFDQKYHGNLTIVPRFTTMQTIGLKVLSDPNVKDMEQYLKYGQMAAWPHLTVIRDMIRVEKALEETLLRLEEQCRLLYPEWTTMILGSNNNQDDLDSIASTSTSTPAARVLRRAGEETAALVTRLQQDNESLQNQVQELTRLLLLSRFNDNKKEEKEHKDEQHHFDDANNILDSAAANFDNDDANHI